MRLNPQIKDKNLIYAGATMKLPGSAASSQNTSATVNQASAEVSTPSQNQSPEQKPNYVRQMKNNVWYFAQPRQTPSRKQIEAKSYDNFLDYTRDLIIPWNNSDWTWPVVTQQSAEAPSNTERSSRQQYFNQDPFGLGSRQKNPYTPVNNFVNTYGNQSSTTK